MEDTGEETILSQPGIKTLSSLIGNVVMHLLDFIETSPLKAALRNSLIHQGVKLKLKKFIYQEIPCNMEGLSVAQDEVAAGLLATVAEAEAASSSTCICSPSSSSSSDVEHSISPLSFSSGSAG